MTTTSTSCVAWAGHDHRSLGPTTFGTGQTSEVAGTVSVYTSSECVCASQRPARGADDSHDQWGAFSYPRSPSDPSSDFMWINTGDLWCFDMDIVHERDLDGKLASLETAFPTSSRLPPIYFRSKFGMYPNPHPSEPVHPDVRAPVHANAESHLRGVVRLTPDDPPIIRWTFIINHTGVDRWRFECVQPCGRGSRLGLLGVWSEFRVHSTRTPLPHGPVWLWKEVEGSSGL